MPSWLQWGAAHQPLTPIIDSIRGLLMRTPLSGEPWWAIGWCLVIPTAAVVWGSWLFRRRAGRR